jgi:hypothetical protein
MDLGVGPCDEPFEMPAGLWFCGKGRQAGEIGRGTLVQGVQSAGVLQWKMLAVVEAIEQLFQSLPMGALLRQEPFKIKDHGRVGEIPEFRPQMPQISQILDPLPAMAIASFG